MPVKKYPSLAAWLDDATVRRLHGVADTAPGVLKVAAILGPFDIGDRLTGRPTARPRVTVNYQPGATVLWSATWEIPVEVDLSAYGLA